MVIQMAKQLLTVLLVVAQACCGVSQLLSLSRNRVGEVVTCETDTVTYTCMTEGIRIQWIAEPFINASGSNTYVVVSGVDPREGNETIGPITVEYTGEVPLITRLFINGSVRRNVTITCATLTNRSSIQFTPDVGKVMPVENLNVVRSIGNFEEGSISVTFEPSPSPEIDHYVVSCMDDTCPSVVLESQETRVMLGGSSNIGGIPHNVTVIAVNRCGRKSPLVYKCVDLYPDQAYVGVVIALPIITAVAIAVAVVAIIYILVKIVPRNTGGSTALPATELEPK